MGYESKLVIAKVSKVTKVETGETLFAFGEIIAEINMSKMYSDFPNIFTNAVDYDVFIDNEDEPTTEDKYGDKLKAADVQTVINYIERKIAEGEEYRRLKPCLAFLKALNTEEWKQDIESGKSKDRSTTKLQVVHYGY